MFDYKITFGDAYTLDNTPNNETPYLSGAVINDATSSANRLTIGGTVSNKLIFNIINPPTMEFDGLKLKVQIKPVTEYSSDSGTGVALQISDISDFLADIEEIPDAPTEDTGDDVNVDVSEMSGTTYEYDTPIGETGDADNDEELINNVYRNDGADISGASSPDTAPVSEWVDFGEYYVTNVVQTSENAVNITALDGFILMGDTFTPTVRNTTATALYTDFAAQLTELGIEADDATLPNITINWSGVHSFREAAGFFASFCGGYASFNRSGYLELRQYRKNTPIINYSDILSFSSNSAAITINAVACDNSASLVDSNWITYGDDDTVELKFKNPYVPESVLPDILAVYLYTVYKPCTVSAQYSYELEAGDFIQVYTTQDAAEWICITNQTINLDTGVVVIESLGNSETLEANSQESPVDAKFKTLYSEMIEAKYINADRVVSDGLEANKADISELVADNLEVGSINGNVIADGTVLAAALSSEAVQTIGGNKVYYQATEPSGGTYVVGDSWYKTVISASDPDQKVLHVWNGSAWTPTDLDASLLRANTITAQEIASNTIEAGNINMDNLQTNIARIGASNGQHIEIDSDSVDIMDSNNKVASFMSVPYSYGSDETVTALFGKDRVCVVAGTPDNPMSEGNYDNSPNVILARDAANNESDVILIASSLMSGTTPPYLSDDYRTASIIIKTTTNYSTIGLYATQITQNERDITYNGASCKLMGNTTTALSLSTTAKNLLTNSIDGMDYESGVYTITTSNGSIKVSKTGVYWVRGCMHVTTGFTANDILHLLVYVNGSLNSQFDHVHRMTSTGYATIEVTGLLDLEAGDYIQLFARNQSGNRGNVQPSNVTQLNITKLY